MSEQKQSLESESIPFSRFKMDALGYIPAIIVPSAVNLMSLMLFTRIFDPAEYGVYTLLLGALTIGNVIGSQWIVQSLQRYRPEYIQEKQTDQFDRNMMVLIGIVTVLMVIIAVPGYCLVRSLLVEYADYYVPVSLLVWTQIIYTIGIALFQSDAKVKEYRTFQVLVSLLRFGISLFWIYYIHFSIAGILWGGVIANLIVLVPLYRKAGILRGSRNGGKQWNSFLPFLNKFLKFGVPMIGWLLATSLMDVCDRFFLKMYRTPGEVGIYAANYSLVASVIGVITFPLMAAIHPIVMRATSELEAEIMVGKFTKIYLLAITPVCLICTLFHKEVCIILLGGAFADGSQIFPVLVVSYSIWYLSFIGHKGYEYKKQTVTMLGFISLGVIGNILFNIVLIPNYGYMGAAYSTLVGFAIYAGCVYAYSRRVVRWRLPWPAIGKLAIITVVLLFLTSLCKAALPVSMLPLIRIGIGSCMILVLYVWGLVVTKELHWLQFKQAARKLRK